MTRLLTAVDADQAAKLRALLTGKPQPAAAKLKAPRAKGKRSVQLVAQAAWSHADTEHTILVVQLPMYLERSQYNAGGARWAKAATAERHINGTLLALRTLLWTWSQSEEARTTIRGVTLVRISPSRLDDDNVVSAFKHIRDAVFAWIACGHKDFDRRAIGHFDKTIQQGIHTCNYEQTKCDADPKAHGIQIRFHV